MSASKEINIRYKQFYIHKIYLNNFLSYADTEQVMPLDSLKGTSIITSTPKNYAGKTTGIVDALTFLFFGRTEKADKNEEIFNIYTNTDEVSVKGEVEIDGIDYLIERTIVRSLKRNKVDYNVNSSLNFWEILPDGTKKDLKGEERRATDKKITEYIGNYDDFLITVVTTIRNFYSLADSKPTERGKIFTRFIGIELLSEKGDICKKMYDDWFKTTALRNTSSTDLTTKIEEENEKLSSYNKLIEEERKHFNEKDNAVKLKKKDIEIEEGKKHKNVDEELYKLKEDDLILDINNIKDLINKKEEQIIELRKELVEPEEVFDIDTYNDITIKYNNQIESVSNWNAKKTYAENTIAQLKDAEICPTCKRPLENVDNSESIKELENQVSECKEKVDKATKEKNKLWEELQEHNKIKELQTIYDKAVLIIDRNELELGNFKNTLQQNEEKLNKYRNNKLFIEENKNIDTKINQLNFQLTELENERETHLLTITGHEADKSHVQKQINTYTALRKDVLKEEALQRIYKTYIDIFGKNGISKMVLGSMIPLINSYLNQMMFDAVPFKLEVRLNTKNEVEFWMIDLEDNGKTKKLKAGSGYESTISLLALRCVLSKVCSLPKPNIVVFDEVFGQVSDENLPLLGAFFERMKEYFDNIFIITHNQAMLDWSDHIIQIKKDKNLSYILTNEKKK